MTSWIFPVPGEQEATPAEKEGRRVSHGVVKDPSEGLEEARDGSTHSAPIEGTGVDRLREVKALAKQEVTADRTSCPAGGHRDNSTPCGPTTANKVCHPTQPKRVAQRGNRDTRPTKTLTIKDMVNHLSKSGTKPGTQSLGTPTKRTRDGDTRDDSPAKKVCHPTQPKWVACPGSKSSMTHPHGYSNTKLTNLGAKEDLGTTASKNTTPGPKRGMPTPGNNEVTHAFMNQAKKQTPQHRGTYRGNPNIKKKMKNMKPNSGNPNIQKNKITQYFTITEETTDQGGIGTGELKGKAGERGKLNKLTHKEGKGIKTNKQIGQGQDVLQTP